MVDNGSVVVRRITLEYIRQWLEKGVETQRTCLHFEPDFKAVNDSFELSNCFSIDERFSSL